MKTLEGRVAIVTGAAAGIGQAIAIKFAKAGAAVAIADIAGASETVEKIKALGGRAIAVECDIASPESIQELLRTVDETYGGIDILVNNAGIYPFAPVEAMAPELWDRVFSVNAKGVFLCSKAAITPMKKRGRGKIINLASGIFFIGLPNAGAYAASKGAVIGFSRVLARELGSDNIQVNVITPGLVKTQGVVNAGLTDEFIDPLVAQQCIKRRETVDDVAGVALFLASDASNFMTGQIVNVDGGVVMH
jgi:3-oxoacyl-[acyl-carrier protein] reductase